LCQEDVRNRAVKLDSAAAIKLESLGVVNAATEAFVEDIRIEGEGVHSVAVNASNNHIFVPVSGKGIFVIAPTK
jgi:hypothetical protein